MGGHYGMTYFTRSHLVSMNCQAHLRLRGLPQIPETLSWLGKFLGYRGYLPGTWKGQTSLWIETEFFFILCATLFHAKTVTALPGTSFSPKFHMPCIYLKFPTLSVSYFHLG